MVEEGVVSGFICDHMLVKLARWLRMAGFDTIVPEDLDDDSIMMMAVSTGRTLITRDRDLSNRKGVRTFRIKSDNIDDQLSELEGLLKVSALEMMRTRCPLCNHVLEIYDIGSVRDDQSIPPSVIEVQDTFYICPGCKKIYWEGTHWKRIERTLRSKGLVPILPREGPQAKSMTCP